jgi:hypothetical protein
MVTAACKWVRQMKRASTTQVVAWCVAGLALLAVLVEILRWLASP